MIIIPSEASFKNQVFSIQMTGQELVRFYDLCCKSEGGERHPGCSPDRFHHQLKTAFPELDRLRELLFHGKLP